MTSSADLALIPLPPRQVRRRPGQGQYLRFALDHFFLVVIGMFAYLFCQIGLGTVLVLWFSTLLPATVTEIETNPGARGLEYHLVVTYRFGQTEYSTKLRESPQHAQALEKGDIVQVDILPERPDRPQRHYENYPVRFVTALMCLFVLAPCAGLGKKLWDVYVVPWKRRTLMRAGAATSGVIVDKKEVVGRPLTYTITYEYPLPAHAVPIKASMKINQEDYERARLGEKVIVLYRSERPAVSVAYQYADYEFA